MLADHRDFGVVRDLTATRQKLANSIGAYDKTSEGMV